jgi:hypothetical protein
MGESGGGRLVRFLRGVAVILTLALAVVVAGGRVICGANDPDEVSLVMIGASVFGTAEDVDEVCLLPSG